MTQEVIGKTVHVDRESSALFSSFSDLRNICAAIPEDKRKDIQVEADSLVAKVQGIEMGLQVSRKEPFSLIEFQQYGQALFPFLFSLHFDPVSSGTDFHVELKAELNGMMKMLIGSKLQDIVDKVTQAVSDAAQGRVPDDMKDYMNR